MNPWPSSANCNILCSYPAPCSWYSPFAIHACWKDVGDAALSPPCLGCSAPLWACQDLTCAARARDQGIQLYTHTLRKAQQHREAPWQHGVTHRVCPSWRLLYLLGALRGGVLPAEPMARGKALCSGLRLFAAPRFFPQEGLWSQLAKEGGVWGVGACVQVLPCLSLPLRCTAGDGHLIPCPLEPVYMVTSSFTPALLFLLERLGDVCLGRGVKPAHRLPGRWRLPARGCLYLGSCAGTQPHQPYPRAWCKQSSVCSGLESTLLGLFKGGLFLQLRSPCAEPEAPDTSSSLPCRGTRLPRRWSSS